jgi:hypothetical protein
LIGRIRRIGRIGLADLFYQADRADQQTDQTDQTDRADRVGGSVLSGGSGRSAQPVREKDNGTCVICGYKGRTRSFILRQTATQKNNLRQSA